MAFSLDELSRVFRYNKSSLMGFFKVGHILPRKVTNSLFSFCIGKVYNYAALLQQWIAVPRYASSRSLL